MLIGMHDYTLGLQENESYKTGLEQTVHRKLTFDDEFYFVQTTAQLL